MSDSREQNLRLLSIFNYIMGGLTMLGALIPVIHLVIGVAMMFAPDYFDAGSSSDEMGARIGGVMFIVIALMIIIPGEIIGFLMILSGKKIARREGYKFSFAIACLQCLNMPMGTILGVYTIILLNKNEYKELYGRPHNKAVK